MKRVKALVAVLIIASALPVGAHLAPPAGATHFRANQINWHTTGTPGEVEFHLSGSWRMSAYDYESAPLAGDWHYTPSVGDVFQPTSFDFGDGSGFSDYWTVTAADAANDVVSAEAHARHTYDGTGPWIAAIDSCCRLSAPLHRNNPDGSVRIETLVNPAVTTASPVSQISPIVDCGIDALCVFQVPSTDADGQARRFRFATSAEAAGPYDTFLQPDGALIAANTGQYTWDTTGASLNSGGDSFFSTQVIIENLDGSGNIVATTPVDFFIRVTDSPNRAPAFDPPTPADGTLIGVAPGGTVTFDVAASDPDPADVVSLSLLGLPSDATFTTTPGNPAIGTFSWPSASTDRILTLLAKDQSGLGALQRSLTVVVETAPEFTPPTPADGSVFQVLSTGTLRFTVKATDADGDIVRLATLGLPAGATYQYVGAPGNPSSALFTWKPGVVGEHTLVLTTFTDDGNVGPTRALTLRATHAPVALEVNPAVARLSTSPAGISGTTVVNNDVYVLFASAFIEQGLGNPAPGKGIAGRTVRFFAGGSFLCEGVSRSDGMAFCQGNLPTRHLSTVLNQGYSATFAGDTTWSPSSASGPVVKNAL